MTGPIDADSWRWRWRRQGQDGVNTGRRGAIPGALALPAQRCINAAVFEEGLAHFVRLVVVQPCVSENEVFRVEAPTAGCVFLEDAYGLLDEGEAFRAISHGFQLFEDFVKSL